MNKKITEAFNSLKEAVKMSPAVFASIAVLGLTQAFYRHIPAGLELNFILLFSVFLLLSETVCSFNKKQKISVYVLLPLLIIINHCVYLFTYKEYIQKLSLSLIIFFCWFGFIMYFRVKEDFLYELKTRIVHILVSVLFFIAVYALIYAMAYFIDNIFNLELEYYDSILYRFANSFSTLTGTIVLASYKKKTEYHNSRFFIIMFKKILPPLLILVLSLALIYFLKVIIFDQSIEFYNQTHFYYIAAVLFFIALSMIHSCEDNGKASRIISAIASVLPLLFIVIILKCRNDESLSKWKSAGFTDTDAYIFHEIILNILISGYCVYLFLKKKKINGTLIYAVLFAAAVLYFPAIGYLNFSEYNTLDSLTETMEKNKYEKFQIRYQEQMQRYTNRFNNKEEYEHFSAYPECSYRNVNETTIIYDKTEYKKAIFEIRLTSLRKSEEIKEPKIFSIDGYTFSLENSGKHLIVRNEANGNSYTFDVYSKIKPLYEKLEKNKTDDKDNKIPEIIFEEKTLRIQVIYYHFTENLKNFSDIGFDLFFKK